MNAYDKKSAQIVNSSQEIGIARQKILDQTRWNEISSYDIVLTKGTFDILHAGHLSLLSFCTKIKASLPEGILVVIVESSESVKIRKGLERPFQNDFQRALQLSLMPCVDIVIIANYNELRKIIEEIKPRYYVKGMDTALADYPHNGLSELLLDLNLNSEVRGLSKQGQVIIFTDDGNLSTSSLIKQIRDNTS